MPHSNTASLEIPENEENTPQLETAYRSILMAVDSSDHSNRATDDAIELGTLYQSVITASHVYAAKMHDLRFKQMEGGLPEQFKEEDELERQRDIHDSLITKGLSIITDSYLIQAEKACNKAELVFKGRSLEGKNYKTLIDEAHNGKYDLLVMGSLGLGAIQGSTIGTVCERVVRRSKIDTLVIKQPERSIKDGPIVAAIDGSKQSYAALVTAFNLAKKWQVPLQVISAFDPYYHYVAFNRIAGVLSDEAGKVFRFKEQEQLHEEIIDDGLAKIYQSHLEVAEQLAEEYLLKENGVTIETHLLTGKPHHAIEQFVEEIDSSLLIIGKIGIHCDDELDIGGNSENLLRNSSCAVLLTQREFTPRVEMVAESTTTWSTQAEEAMTHIPPFVQNMARAAILRYAQGEGHTVITASIVEEATKNMCPAGMKNLDNLVDAATEAKNVRKTKTPPAGAFNMQWSAEADEMLQQVSDTTLRHNTKMRAEKRALTEKSSVVETDHILPFVINPTVKKQKEEKKSSKCPFASMGDMSSMTAQSDTIDYPWEKEALERLKQIPEGTSRDMTRKATNAIAQQQSIESISLDFLEQILSIFNSGSKDASKKIGKTLPWDKDAQDSISKAPPMVQGMLAREIEAYAKRENLPQVDLKTAEKAKKQWADEGQFHLDPSDPRNHS